ncbi:hypothetical protein [Epilithonimonas mollis]|uniref:Uncharacterized protein n=1 Tax=Epilithonimonas mollis TaxID=216903 RepID=A0A1M6UJQ3_9FLAO|nr:hypothetical protein [Epilithonimonas mollis]SHK69464.1 hypothetical protein SAMN05444371_3336 [Epilithonimonas mollis]
MKITIKIDPESLFLVQSILVLKRSIFARTLEEKVNQSMTLELFEMVTKKCFAYSLSRNGKNISFQLKFHLAKLLFDLITNQNKTAFGHYEQNKLEILKNDLHQKLV